MIDDREFQVEEETVTYIKDTQGETCRPSGNTCTETTPPCCVFLHLPRVRFSVDRDTGYIY